MKTIQLGEYGIPIVFTQSLDITTATIYLLYTKPDGTIGVWNTVKSGTSFYYLLEEGDIDQINTWIIWVLAVWDDKLLWTRVALKVKNAPISRIPV